MFFSIKRRDDITIQKERNYLVQGVQVINSSFSVHHETVLVHLDVRRTPVEYKIRLYNAMPSSRNKDK